MLAFRRTVNVCRVTRRDHPVLASKAPTTKIQLMTDIPMVENFLEKTLVRRAQIRRTLARTSNSHWTYRHHRLTAKRASNLADALVKRLHELKGTMKYPYLVPMDLPVFEHRNPHIQAVTVVPKVEREPDTLIKNEEMYYKLKGTRYH